MIVRARRIHGIRARRRVRRRSIRRRGHCRRIRRRRSGRYGQRRGDFRLVILLRIDIRVSIRYSTGQTLLELTLRRAVFIIGRGIASSVTLASRGVRGHFAKSIGVTWRVKLTATSILVG